MDIRYQCPFCNFINTFGNDVLPDERTLCSSCKKPIAVPRGIGTGIVIDDYVVEEFLGKGSIGSVYKATQLSLGRTVALKVLHNEFRDAKGLTDFLREARAAANLNHLNLVQCYAVGESDGYVFMAMNYITGLTLKERLRRDKVIQTDEALHITQQVAEGLHYAWAEAHIIHRDIKPENIILSETGLVKVTDLGLAIRPDEWKEGMEISGSPAYMSPEQFYGEKLDPRTDIYSLGVSLYQMLAGTLPFRAEDVNDLARQHIRAEAIPLSKVNRNIPAYVSALVRKMMAKYPEDRFLNMEDLLDHVWRIRQKTAPDTDLVPSIHTISVRRLDYELQLEARKMNKNITQHNDLNPYIPIGTLKKTWNTHPAFWLISALITLILFGIIGILWAKNNALVRANEPTQAELILRKKIETFKERIAQINVTDAYVDEQSRAIMHEIETLPRGGDIKDIMNLLLEQYAMRNENKKNENAQIANEQMREELTAVLEKNKLLEAKIELLSEGKNIDPMSPDYINLRKNYESMRIKLKFNETALDSAQKQIADQQRMFRSDVRILSIFYFYLNLRFGPPGITIGFLENSPLHLQQFSADEIQFFNDVAQIHFRMAELINKPSGFTGNTLILNGVQYKVSGSSNTDLLLSDNLKKITRIPIIKMNDETLVQLMEQSLPKSDTQLLRYTYHFAKGDIGEAMKYVEPQTVSCEITLKILDVFFDRLYYLMRKHPQNIPKYEATVRRITGDSPLTREYVRKFEEYLQMYQALKPTEPMTDSVPIRIKPKSNKNSNPFSILGGNP